VFTKSLSNKAKLSKSFLDKAKYLRSNATEAEDYLWKILRNRKLNGLKFRRQHPLHRGFILDFYCDELKLAIELDGSYHNATAQKAEDMERTIIINSQGINVIRFSNAEILDNTENVLNKILAFVK
jgi:very-short-patch-repair endonuclease